MSAFDLMNQYGYGELHLARDARTGLTALIGIHNTQLGPALGGCRFIEYETEQAALTDVCRLARGMTYKACLAGLKLGGGKSVIMKPKGSFDREALFRSFGKFVENLGGRYITAEDSGTSLEDMEIIRTETKHVTGVSAEHGGGGDPSPYTALGVRRGIEAYVKFHMGRTSLDGIHVAIQGVGAVGYYLAKEVHALGARLTVADIDPVKTERIAKEFGAKVAGLNDIFAVECDVFAPCALGAILNTKTVPMLRCKIVAGASNNQLAVPSDGEALLARQIAYAPDYAINAGGLINVAEEVTGYNEPRSREKVIKIYDTMYEIAERAKSTNKPEGVVADSMVHERLGLTPQ